MLADVICHDVVCVGWGSAFQAARKGFLFFFAVNLLISHSLVSRQRQRGNLQITRDILGAGGCFGCVGAAGCFGCIGAAAGWCERAKPAPCQTSNDG